MSVESVKEETENSEEDARTSIGIFQIKLVSSSTDRNLYNLCFEKNLYCIEPPLL